jgi:hypothetical protein
MCEGTEEKCSKPQVSSTSSFKGEVKWSAPCHKILQHVKKTLQSMKEILSAKLTAISPGLLLGVCWYLPESSGG